MGLGRVRLRCLSEGQKNFLSINYLLFRGGLTVPLDKRDLIASSPSGTNKVLQAIINGGKRNAAINGKFQ